MHRFELAGALFAGWLAGLLAAPAAEARVVDATPTGFTIENSRDVPVAPAAAWQALVRDVDHWWPKDHRWWGAGARLSIDPVAGGCFCERGANGVSAEHLRVVFVEPDKLLRMAGGLGPLQGMGLQGVMEWRLAPVDGGTRITLFYRAGGYAPEDLAAFARVVDGVQTLQLGSLAAHLGADPAGTP